jgi:hypothetical protein
MPAGHPFFSSKKAGAGLAGLILLAMAGCSANESRLAVLDGPATQTIAAAPAEPPGMESAKALAVEKFEAIKTAAADGFDVVKSATGSGMAKIKSTLQTGNDKLEYAALDLQSKLKPSVVPADSSELRVTHVEPASDQSVPAAERNEESAWCTALRERALADSSVLRGPRIAGSFDDQGKGEVSLGLNYSDFRKAALVEQRAEAECRKFMAQKGLQKLVASSPQNLTSAGFRAKADAIDAERFELERLRQNVASSMSAGHINHEKATALLVLIEQLRADGLTARSQADRRIDEHGNSKESAQQLGGELLAAERDLDAIDSATRTADNVDLNVQAGYNQFVYVVPEGTGNNTQGFGGKVSFSMKLGVINPRRFEHERLATEAKQRAIRTEDGGPIWQAEEMRLNQQRAISALRESQIRIENAMAETRKLLVALSDVSQPEFEAAKLNARYQLLKMQADKAAVAGSLAQIRTNLKHLNKG